jgi:hypothetical protein
MTEVRASKSNAAGDPVVPSKKATGGKRSPGLQEKPRRSGAKGVSCKSGIRRVHTSPRSIGSRCGCAVYPAVLPENHIRA